MARLRLALVLALFTSRATPLVSARRHAASDRGSASAEEGQGLQPLNAWAAAAAGGLFGERFVGMPPQPPAPSQPAFARGAAAGARLGMPSRDGPGRFAMHSAEVEEGAGELTAEDYWEVQDGQGMWEHQHVKEEVVRAADVVHELQEAYRKIQLEEEDAWEDPDFREAVALAEALLARAKQARPAERRPRRLNARVAVADATEPNQVATSQTAHHVVDPNAAPRRLEPHIARAVNFIDSLNAVSDISNDVKGWSPAGQRVDATSTPRRHETSDILGHVMVPDGTDPRKYGYGPSHGVAKKVVARRAAAPPASGMARGAAKELPSTLQMKEELRAALARIEALQKHLEDGDTGALGEDVEAVTQQIDAITGSGELFPMDLDTQPRMRRSPAPYRIAKAESTEPKMYMSGGVSPAGKMQLPRRRDDFMDLKMAKAHLEGLNRLIVENKNDVKKDSRQWAKNARRYMAAPDFIPPSMRKAEDTSSTQAESRMEHDSVDALKKKLKAAYEQLEAVSGASRKKDNRAAIARFNGATAEANGVSAKPKSEAIVLDSPAKANGVSAKPKNEAIVHDSSAKEPVARSWFDRHLVLTGSAAAAEAFLDRLEEDERSGEAARRRAAREKHLQNLWTIPPLPIKRL
mmetsp:Transcript_25442/g.73448  ORF Transcript_25442/g.73448 Transcript_25442/m.73448 type:complete len:636 (-) Transcript_25442:239-2146(-)